MGDKKPRVLTGDRPTGQLHLGHYCGSLAKRLELQGQSDLFVMIADLQALTDNFDNADRLAKNVFEVACDYLSVGLDPNKSTIFIQSKIPEICQLNVVYLNFVVLARLLRNPTVKTELKARGFEESVPVGFLSYPVSQAADITAFDAELVPVGQDQIPIIEQCHEIVDRFNSIYGPTLVRPKAVVPESDAGRLVGIDGQAKMSKSQNNAIFLADSADVVKAKVMKMYTDPDHTSVNLPGKIEGNTVFQFLDIFCSDVELVNGLKDHYRRGGLGDVKVKMVLVDVLNGFLDPIRERRKVFQADQAQIIKVLQEGSSRARETAGAVYKRVIDAMKIDYWK